MWGKFRPLRWLGAGAALFIIGQCTATRTSYSAICARCLQHISGYEKTFFGIRVSRRERMVQGHGGLMSPDIFGPPISPSDPKVYHEITGKPCDHAYMRSGFCRYNWGMVACGSYGRSRQYMFRNSLVDRVYGAYLRTKDGDLARDTLTLLDERYPIAGDKVRAETIFYTPPSGASAAPQEPLSLLHDGLGIVTTGDEWRALLAAVRSGGEFSMTTDLSGLMARLKDDSTTVRRHALERLVALNQPEAWKAVAGCLKSPGLSDPAIRSIITHRQFEYWPHALQTAARPKIALDIMKGWLPFDRTVADAVGTLEDEELRTLLAMRDRNVDLICLDQIRKGCRFALHEEVLQVLNERREPAVRQVLELLLSGPDPFDNGSGTRESDPLSWLFRSNPSGSSSEKGSSGGQGDPIQKEIVRLAKERSPESWSKIKELADLWRKKHEHWWSVNLSSAAFAQAMYLCDPSRTRDWLSTELRASIRKDPGTISYQSVPILNAMGAIADPAFLPVLQEFTSASRLSMVGNPYYRMPHDYAFHHCRQMHRWTLKMTSAGAYVIQKPAN